MVVDSDARTVVSVSRNDLVNFSGDFWNIQCGESNSINILSDQDIAIDGFGITWIPRWY